MQEMREKGEPQRTLAIIRPDAYRERGDEILAQIKVSTLVIVDQGFIFDVKPNFFTNEPA